METLTINDVNGPNDRGWYDVELSDGRTATTKDKKLADVAFQARGTLVKAEVTQKPASNPKFPDNIYLNKIEVLGGADDGAVATAAPAPAASIPPSKQQETQERIARQWAYGRAVEILVAQGVSDPLSDKDKTQLSEIANWLLDQTK